MTRQAPPLHLNAVPAGPHAAGFVLVLPGGSYLGRSASEAQPVTDWLARHGVRAGHLEYTVAPANYPEPVVDVLATIADLRAGRHGDIDGPIAVIGFSAGGHLAGLAATATPRELHTTAALTGRTIPEVGRPDLAILGYPVVSMAHRPHLPSRISLIGADASDEMACAVSIESRVDTATPPMFLWHTGEDTVVPAAHSVILASALGVAGVDTELHLFQRGAHGLALAQPQPALRAQGWADLCLAWLTEHGFAPHWPHLG